jgi:hypothetical protein
MTLGVHALVLAAAVLPVPGTGDFNGDGLADLAGWLTFAPDWPRAVPVIFGSREHVRVRPGRLGSRGFLFGVR